MRFKIEASLSKDEILQLYINQIYLGQRAYGFAAAAQIYFGKALKDVSVAEAAMLAGLPKAPSSFNPVVNPKRAKQRQLYVLRRMHDLGDITDAQFAEAQKTPIAVKHEADEYALHAEYVAEMVRQMLFERFGDEVYSKGYRIYTTITKADQEAAYAALRRGVLDYDKRHGYRGPEGYVELPADGQPDEAIEEALAEESRQRRPASRGGARGQPEAGARLPARRGNRNHNRAKASNSRSACSTKMRRRTSASAAAL